MTTVTCYWKRSKLASIGTSLKFIKTKAIGKAVNQSLPVRQRPSLLDTIKVHCKKTNAYSTQLTRYFKEPSPADKLSIHFLINAIPTVQPYSAKEFIKYCENNMPSNICEEAQEATKDQSVCPLWHELRYARITASKAYDAAHCKKLDGVLVEQIIGSKKLKDTEAMKRGRNLERLIIKEVEKRIGEKIMNTGLLLNKEYPVIGASPDGVCTRFAIEIKCPFSERAFSRYKTKENKIAAKYMTQVQIQMHFSKKTSALFCIAHPDFESTKNLTIIEVVYDEAYCKNIIGMCNAFWESAIFPILVNKT